MMKHQFRHLLRHRHRLFRHTKIIPSSYQIHPQFYTNSSLISPIPSPTPTTYPSSSLVALFTERETNTILVHKVSILKDKLLKHQGDTQNIHNVLRDFGSPLFSRYVDGSAFVELLKQIFQFPQLALEVFNWRRKHSDFNIPLSSEEYSKGIRVAGEAKDVDLANELFTEAVNNRCKSPSTYNALMSAYMTNGLAEKCQLLFREFKKEQNCSPNIVTYNILILVFGRLMLIDHMEATLQQMYDSGIVPNSYTFNNLIAGYVTAWMWDRMENTYLIIKETSTGPNIDTYKLMVRGYAHSGNIKKMEEMFDLLKQLSNEDHIILIKQMISAYCKSKCEKKIDKIEVLLKLVPELEYKSWLIVALIQVYAREKLLERMEDIINVAFRNKLVVTSVFVMRSIATAYFHHNTVDKLSSFVKRAECANWGLCRSLYHCQMVLYSLERRLEEMESVLEEMEKVNINNRSKKSLAILTVAYSKWGEKCKLEQVIALMLKLGYDIRSEELNL